MAKFIMRSAWLAHCVTQSNKEGGVFVRINARCDYTKAIREEHGWVELPNKSKNMDLEGSFARGIVSLVSQQGTLGAENGTLDLPYTEVTTFRAVRVQDKDQESTRVELRFHIITTHDDAARMCQLYKVLAKKSFGQMTINVGAGAPEGKQPEAPAGQQSLMVVPPTKGKGKNGKGAMSAKDQLAAAVAAEGVLVKGPEAEASEGAIAASLSGQTAPEALH